MTLKREKAREILEAHGIGFTVEEFDEAISVAFDTKEPQGLDEAAEKIANEHGFVKHPSCKPAKYSYQAVRDVFIEAAVAGAKWMAEQFDLEANGEITQRPDGTLCVCIYIDERSGYKLGDNVICQIRKEGLSK